MLKLSFKTKLYTNAYEVIQAQNEKEFGPIVLLTLF